MQLSSAGCRACGHTAFRLLARPYGAPAAGQGLASQASLMAQGRARQPFRYPTFHSTQHRQKDQSSPAIEELASRDVSKEQSISEQAPPAAERPWYLDVEPPRHPTAVFEPPPLSDVPDDAPRILEPLVKFSSDDLGLDDLVLLDLRAIHPPPALGPKLLMLFGTARSERHLHVSADRLVRWLHSRGLSAHADGLLGRNELKIRLRRKARKAKMLGTSGGALRDNADDGIRTGWVCVNLGTTGWSDDEVAVVDEDGKLSGFGVPQTGTTIVVQLMTDAKRKEMDLETLWSRMLSRSLKKDRDTDPEESLSEPASDQTSSKARGSVTKSDFASPSTQQRFFSTMVARRMWSSDRKSAMLQDQSQPDIAVLNPQELANSLRADMDYKMVTLERLKTHFADTSGPDVLKALSTTSGEPSTFLRVFNMAMEDMSRTESWPHRLWLQNKGRMTNHPDYELAGLMQLIEEMELNGIVPTRNEYMDTFRALMSTDQDERPVPARCRLAMRLLDTMSQRGESVLSQGVLVAMIESLVWSGYQGQDAKDLQARLESLLDEAGFPCMEEALMKRLMAAYATQGNWDVLWETWRIPPKFSRGRSADLYAFLFRLMADTKHQSRCIDALRWAAQEMFHEVPAIKPEGELLEALKDCARVADPEAEAIADSLAAGVTDLGAIQDWETAKLANREFVKLFLSLREYS